ncbi:12532_t:CDS:2, partial [Ambispora gerdemannii]
QNSFNVTPIKSESGGAYSTPVKQIRSSSDLRESSASVTPIRSVNNNYRESQEQMILTKDEVKNFRDYLISQRNAGEGLYGNLIYRLYPGLHDHSWNYLRAYAIKHIIPTLSGDTNKDGFELKQLKMIYNKPVANSSDGIYEDDHYRINIDQIQDDENPDSSEEDSDSQTLTVVEGNSPFLERVECHFMTNHDAGDYYPAGSAKISQVVNNFSRSNQVTNNINASSSNFTTLLKLNGNNNESSEREKITTSASQFQQAILQNNKQLSSGNQITSSNSSYRHQNRSIASSSRSMPSILSMNTDNGDSLLNEEAIEQLCESPTINNLSRQYSRDSTLNIPLATPQIQAFNQVPSSKALGKRPAPSTCTTDNHATDHSNPKKKRKFSSIKNFDSSDLKEIPSSKYGSRTRTFH